MPLQRTAHLSNCVQLKRMLALRRTCPSLHRPRDVRASVVFGRRAAVVASAGLLDSLLGGQRGQDPRALTRSGMQKFRQDDVEGSVIDFDGAIQASPSMKPYMWQRGLSLYYLRRFEEAAEQFRIDVAVNPNDTEESIWTFLSEAQLMGPEAARKQYLEVGRDSRPYMRQAYECFRTGSDPQQIMAFAKDPGSTFYSLLYVGLWHEAHGTEGDAARKAIEAAAATPYARASGDYMADLARIHCLRRGWTLPA